MFLLSQLLQHRPLLNKQIGQHIKLLYCESIQEFFIYLHPEK